MSYIQQTIVVPPKKSTGDEHSVNNDDKIEDSEKEPIKQATTQQENQLNALKNNKGDVINTEEAILKNNEEKKKEENSDQEPEEVKEKENELKEKLRQKRITSLSSYINWAIFTIWCSCIYVMFIWWIGLILLFISAVLVTAIRLHSLRIANDYTEEKWRRFSKPMLIMSIVCYVCYSTVIIYLLVELIRQGVSYSSYSMMNVLNSSYKVFYPMITSTVGIYMILGPTFALHVVTMVNYKKLPNVSVK